MAVRAARPPKSRKPLPKRMASASPQTGAELLAELDALNLPPGYGDPTIDSSELARQIREQFSRRDHDSYKTAP